MKALEAQDILEEAIALINGNRAEDYGDAQKNFQHMADLVNLIIKKADGKLSASDMALVMIQVKIARLQEPRIMRIAGQILRVMQHWVLRLPSQGLRGHPQRHLRLTVGVS